MEIVKVILSGLLTFVTFLCGGFDLPIQLLLLALVLDFVTGLIRSGIKGDINSSIGFKGLLKKVGKLCVVTVGVTVDLITNAQGAVRIFVIYYLLATELISIIENLGEAGVPIPAKLKQAIKDFKEKNDGQEATGTNEPDKPVNQNNQ